MNVFTQITNAECVLPIKNKQGGKRFHKTRRNMKLNKKRSVTYKNRK